MTTPTDTATDTAKLADEIEGLAKKHEYMEATMAASTLREAAAALRELDVLKAENAKLREALEPFARAARSIDVDPPSDHEPSHGRGSVTAGDLRRARAALGGAG